jgi:hypothetical protein
MRYRKKLTRKASNRSFQRGTRVSSKNRRPIPVRGGIRL